jgi:hypothetical protein
MVYIQGMNKAKERNCMDAFFRGMGMIGQIYPPSHPHIETSPESAWNGVGDAFAQTGDNIRDALKEFRYAQGIEPQ